MKTLRAGPPIDVNEIQLIPIEMTCVYGHATPQCLTAVAGKEAVAVVILSDRGAWALDLDGCETPLDNLLRDVEGLRDRAEK